MIKVTILALFMGLSSVAESGASRLLLQAVAPPAPPAQYQPPVQPGQGVPQPAQPYPQIQPTPGQGIPPAVPQQQPQRPAYNPYGAQNPLCNPYSPYYDVQDCYQYGGMMNQGNQGNGGMMNQQNPFCNPYSPMYDIQDCYQYGYMYQQPRAPVVQQPSQPQVINTYPGVATPPNANTGNPARPVSPYCNPHTPFFDIQDCYQYGGMMPGNQGGAQNPLCNPNSPIYDRADCLQSQFPASWL
eukprot:CAMPEP_0201591766 /NCGR_PEP_ID=MMETSP0190_2-20130828/189843_1 /ASSEMBLY_ACC=CAM_ASM_000263 /TAXON_ID=37353 /ORGANISM="Rosalina sp." /LENGTH=241 /DNA_ID=CAMNT_0048050227 /DNA_START=8 /DNA_END=733 /DNA_ORIENTATION=-